MEKTDREIAILNGYKLASSLGHGWCIRVWQHRGEELFKVYKGPPYIKRAEYADGLVEIFGKCYSNGVVHSYTCFIQGEIQVIETAKTPRQAIEKAYDQYQKRNTMTNTDETRWLERIVDGL